MLRLPDSTDHVHKPSDIINTAGVILLMLSCDLAGSSLVEDSPFIPNGWRPEKEANQTVEKGAQVYEFLGVYQIGQMYSVNLYNPAEGKGSWIRVGDMNASIKVIAYESDNDEVWIRENGENLKIRLKQNLPPQNHQPAEDVDLYSSMPYKTGQTDKDGEILDPLMERYSNFSKSGGNMKIRRGGFIYHDASRNDPNPADKSRILNPLSVSGQTVYSETAESIDAAEADSFGSEYKFAPRNALQRRP